MDKEIIKNRVLLELYLAWFSETRRIKLEDLMLKEGWEKIPFENLVKELKQKSLIESCALGGLYVVTPGGIIHVEELSVAPQATIVSNRQARTSILLTLAKVHEAKGYMYSCEKSELLSETNF